MDVGETLYVTSREEWRRWLADHHRDKKEIWLIFYKKASGQPSIPYDDAVEEAVCHGWVDSQMKSLDESRYAIRFTPRRKKSHWSDSNKGRALKMLREGKMTPAGMALLPSEVLQMWKGDMR
jgi:uncharacterized protein YdeI (YjbR/CyaY-like superfamily)